MGISLADFSLYSAIGGEALSVLGAYKSSEGTKQGYNYNAAVARNNAQYAEMQAQDAIARGENAVDVSRMKTTQLASRQRALMAAHGVALDEGSPLNILNDTAYMGEHDARTLADNAAKEAWALRRQAANYTDQSSLLSARASDEEPWLNAAGTLLTQSGQVADRWYKYSKTLSPS